MPPSLVGSIASVAEADQLLEGLDRLAQSTCTDGEFWRQVLVVIQGLTSAQGVGVLYPTHSEWLTVARSGDVHESHLSQLAGSRLQNPTISLLEGKDTLGTWVAELIDPKKQTASGVLLLEYPHDAPESLVESGRLLLEPFCEIVRTRQESTRCELDRSWMIRLESTIRSLAQASAPQQVAQILVDQMVDSLEAARISMVTRDEVGDPTFRLFCSSGALAIDRTSPTVKRLEQIAEIASKSPGVCQWSDRSPLPHSEYESDSSETRGQSRDSFGIFSNGVALTWNRSVNRIPISWLIIEWPDPLSMNKAIPLLSSCCNTLHSVWLQQDRWTRIPASVRKRFNRPRASFGKIGRNWIRRSLWILSLAGLLWGLTLPFPMTIESKAILEPVSRRLIHASADGYIADLLVDDGDRVVAQQELARLRSPSLDLQIEEAMGRLRSIAEKRNGLKVAINQLPQNAQDSLANQTRLSTELLMLDSSEAQAREMLAFYQAEQSRLILRSPIDGIVVAKRLKQELENRPIRRGDPILQVVDLSGDWQLRIQVADRDSEYVGRYYGERNGESNEKEIRYTFDSLPSQQFVAEVADISRVIENKDGLGGFQEVLANVVRDDANRAHMGATARVRFACGKEPFGYVWSRPMIEFLQKRFRLFSWQQQSPATPLTDSR